MNFTKTKVTRDNIHGMLHALYEVIDMVELDSESHGDVISAMAWIGEEMGIDVSEMLKDRIGYHEKPERVFWTQDTETGESHEVETDYFESHDAFLSHDLQDICNMTVGESLETDGIKVKRIK